MFQKTMTRYGFCCTFNSQNTFASRSSNNRLFSPDLGLKVTLNSSASDDFQSIFSIDGFIVLIYEPNKFPDITSSGVNERFISSGFETFLAITAKALDSDNSIKSFVNNIVSKNKYKKYKT